MSSGYPKISPPQVSVRGLKNVSLKCLVETRRSDCISDELQWHFFDRPLKSGEKYEIQERKTKIKCKRVSMITILNVGYADEGKYSCRLRSCYPYTFRVIQLKVLSGMNNCVIISSAFSKGDRVGEIFRYKEERGKKINAEMLNAVPVTRNLSFHFELLFCKETISYDRAMCSSRKYPYPSRRATRV